MRSACPALLKRVIETDRRSGLPSFTFKCHWRKLISFVAALVRTIEPGFRPPPNVREGPVLISFCPFCKNIQASNTAYSRHNHAVDPNGNLIGALPSRNSRLPLPLACTFDTLPMSAAYRDHECSLHDFLRGVGRPL